MCRNSPDTHNIQDKPLELFKRFWIVVAFSIAFAYIEAAVVVYLRTIFYPDGFSFPLPEFTWNRQLLLTEIGREAATMVLIITGAWLFGQNSRQRFAYFSVIFAVWDIFYYVWLKVLLDWPCSIMDWDILFLIPTTWASPVLAPVLVSLTLLVFAVIILYRDSYGLNLKITRADWFGFVLTGLAVVISFCIAGRHITTSNYKYHFYWPLFALGHVLAIVLFIRCLFKSK